MKFIINIKFIIAWNFHAHEISKKFLALKFLLPPSALRLTPCFNSYYRPPPSAFRLSAPTPENRNNYWNFNLR
jgi:hypothetical protein